MRSPLAVLELLTFFFLGFFRLLFGLQRLSPGQLHGYGQLQMIYSQIVEFKEGKAVPKEDAGAHKYLFIKLLSLPAKYPNTTHWDRTNPTRLLRAFSASGFVLLQVFATIQWDWLPPLRSSFPFLPLLLVFFAFAFAHCQAFAHFQIGFYQLNAILVQISYLSPAHRIMATFTPSPSPALPPPSLL